VYVYVCVCVCVCVPCGRARVAHAHGNTHTLTHTHARARTHTPTSTHTYTLYDTSYQKFFAWPLRRCPAAQACTQMRDSACVSPRTAAQMLKHSPGRVAGVKYREAPHLLHAHGITGITATSSESQMRRDSTLRNSGKSSTPFGWHAWSLIKASSSCSEKFELNVLWREDTRRRTSAPHACRARHTA
jgi:hypothetical protein